MFSLIFNFKRNVDPALKEARELARIAGAKRQFWSNEVRKILGEPPLNPNLYDDISKNIKSVPQCLLDVRAHQAQITLSKEKIKQLDTFKKEFDTLSNEQMIASMKDILKDMGVLFTE